MGKISKNDKEVLCYVADKQIRNVLHGETVSMEEFLVEINKTRILDREYTTEDIPAIIKLVEEDDYTLDDCTIDEDGIREKVYEPYTTIFETSGKIIVENDLREFFIEESFNVNATKGIIKTMDHYAKQGMLHGYVGNSCPTLFLSEDNGEILIGAEFDGDAECEEDENLLPDDSYKELAFVCTDLWWYSIVDLEDFKAKNPDVDLSGYEIVDIPKGRWELKHRYGVSSKGYHDELPYATLNLLKD